MAKNTSSFATKFLETIACNRSFVRCVRNFLNVHIVGDDEIDKSDGSPPSKQSSDMSPVGVLKKSLKEKHSITEYEEFKDLLRDLHKQGKVTKISIDTIEGVDLFNDFESISGLLKNLDLFITVSNSTAHLAGSLGVPTWLIKPKNHATFFYWNQDNNKTPWYSSIKIYSTKSEYEETILDIKKDFIKTFNIQN